MSDSLLHTVIGTALGIILFRMWLRDLKFLPQTTSFSLPGATPSTLRACIIASVGAAVIVLIISGAEHATGIADQQSRIPFFYLLPMLGAAITEEVIFRGYLIVCNRGKTMLIASACFFSFLFAAIHPYLWEHTVADPTGFEWLTTLRIRLDTYSVIATTSIAVLSLWYYYVRFSKQNPHRSLIPCFCAHASANLAVFIMKLSSGYVTTH